MTKQPDAIEHNQLLCIEDKLQQLPYRTTIVFLLFRVFLKELGHEDMYLGPSYARRTLSWRWSKWLMVSDNKSFCLADKNENQNCILQSCIARVHVRDICVSLSAYGQCIILLTCLCTCTVIRGWRKNINESIIYLLKIMQWGFRWAIYNWLVYFALFVGALLIHVCSNPFSCSIYFITSFSM
jgi:hypothetical protein